MTDQSISATSSAEPIEVAPYVEQDCTFTHEGHDYTAAGAIVTPEYAIAYVAWRDDRLVITDWHGKELGAARLTARWRLHSSWQGTHVCQIEATIGGVNYTGRSFGSGALWRGHRMANQSRPIVGHLRNQISIDGSHLKNV